jgi:hypothetical protein
MTLRKYSMAVTTEHQQTEDASLKPGRKKEHTEGCSFRLKPQEKHLVFNLRPDNTIISKDEAKRVWLAVCEKAVQGADSGKCKKD